MSDRPEVPVADGVLVGRFVGLRAITPADYDWIYALHTHPAVLGRFRLGGQTIDPASLPDLLWRDTLTQFAVVMRRASRPIGLVQAYGSNMRDGYTYVAMVVDPSLHGRGWPLEAGVLFVDHLFARWPLRKLYLEGTARTVEPATDGLLGGLVVEEARLSEHEYMDGHHEDFVVRALYRDMWARARRDGWGFDVARGRRLHSNEVVTRRAAS